MTQSTSFNFYLEPDNSQRLSTFCGELNTNISQISDFFKIKITNRGNFFQLQHQNPNNCEELSDKNLASIADNIQQLYQSVSNTAALTPDHLHLSLLELNKATHISEQSIQPELLTTSIKTRKVIIKPRGGNQQYYVNAIKKHDISFGIGPAGTGKTFLAVACAVEAFLNDQVERILLVRPAVEAGEKLGFLPGDLSQKIDPYLRPLYDALYLMLGIEYTGKLIEANQVEIAPLAYMRGRTLSNAFVIFDESQNSTQEQMKMLLTRIGFGSKVVVTGDQSQIDLPNKKSSGLLHAQKLLKNVKGVNLNYFDAKDVVRHPVVQRIIEAYDKVNATSRETDASQSNA